MEKDELILGQTSSGDQILSGSSDSKVESNKSKLKTLLKLHPFIVFVAISVLIIGVTICVGGFYFFAVKTESTTHSGVPTDPVGRAKWLHENHPLIDGHNDLPFQFLELVKNNVSALDISVSQPRIQTDIPRLTSAIYGGQFWSVYIPCTAQGDAAVQLQLGQIDVARRFIQQNNQYLQLVTSYEEFANSWKNKRIGSLLGMEGGHAINNSLSNLRSFYNLGVRYMTLTHNCDTLWAESATGVKIANISGLTGFGKEVVKEMNRLGMIVDLAHVSDKTMSDALSVSKAPVIFSHSGVRTICNTLRNVPDSLLDQVKQNNGVIMVVFFARFVKTDISNLTVSDVVDHINYINKTIGIDHIGIGSDFDGADMFPSGLQDVGQMRNLTVKLLETGYSDSEVIKIMGGNVLRVLQAVEQTALTMKNVRASDDICCY